MSSCQIVLSPSLPGSVSRTPVYAGFSSTSDTLAVLWESGYVELWSLQTRLQGGRGKAMDPSRTWFGQVCNDARQIKLSSFDAKNTSSLVVLSSSRELDSITFLNLTDAESVAHPAEIALPQRNCRLIGGEGHFACQAPNGTIHQCIFRNFISIHLANSFSQAILKRR